MYFFTVAASLLLALYQFFFYGSDYFKSHFTLTNYAGNAKCYLVIINVIVCIFFVQVNSPLNDPVLGKVGLVVKNPDFTFNKEKVLKVSKVWHTFFPLCYSSYKL